MQNIEGKVAYITGGTKGIGLGIAKSLVENGLKVAISGRNIDDVEKARHYLGNFAPVDELSLEDWNAMIDTNLTGVFHTIKASVEALKVSKGYYISIASLAGTNFFANGAGYNASKFGVVGFTQAAMLDLRNYDIKCTTIMPGSVTSNFNDHVPNSEDGWKIQPEDLGQMVVDLLKMNPNVLPSKIEVRPTKTK